MGTHQGHDAQPVHLPGRAVRDSLGRGAAAAGRGGSGQGPAVRGGNGTQRAEPAVRLQAAAAHAALDLLRALLRVLLLLLYQSEGKTASEKWGIPTSTVHWEKQHLAGKHGKITVSQRVFIKSSAANRLYLISLLIASNCSCSIMAKVWASAWPLGDSRSTELKMVSLSSSTSDASTSLSNACATFANTLACWALSQSCSFRVWTYKNPLKK